MIIFPYKYHCANKIQQNAHLSTYFNTISIYQLQDTNIHLSLSLNPNLPTVEAEKLIFTHHKLSVTVSIFNNL